MAEGLDHPETDRAHLGAVLTCAGGRLVEACAKNPDGSITGTYGTWTFPTSHRYLSLGTPPLIGM